MRISLRLLYIGLQMEQKTLTFFQKNRILCGLVLGILFYTAPVQAESGQPSAEEVSVATKDPDPLEGFNRAMFDTNFALDMLFVRPVMEGYRLIIPGRVRGHISNAFTNLREPLSFLGYTAQFKLKHAGVSFLRFLVNSTIGFFGAVDVASRMGLKQDLSDFGQALGSHGMKSGPYLVLPLFGPTNFRDLIGTVGGIFLDPVSYFLRKKDQRHLIYWRLGGEYISDRDQLTNVLDKDIYLSKDPYTRMRVLYMLRRKSLIHPRNTLLDDGPQPVHENELIFADEDLETRE